MSDFQKPSSRDDDLFSPSLQGQMPLSTAKKPWRLRSQFWVAFLGGITPCAVIAYINSGRLGVPKSQRLIILLTGLAGLIAEILLVLSFPAAGAAKKAYEVRQNIKWAKRITAVVVYLVCAGVQKSSDRVYQYRTGSDDDYESLLGPGAVAVFGIGLIEALLLYGLRELVK